MAKRELSSTLKNLKFMQRGVHKEANEDREEEGKSSVQLDFSISAPSMRARKCVVIMEGDPHPGAVGGRMSFQSFNPSIDKMNGAAANTHQVHVKPSSNEHQNGKIADRSNDSNMSATDHELVVDHKRKQIETDIEPSSPLRLENEESEDGHGQSYHRSRAGSKKHEKRGKLDWNVLRPPKPETRRA